jgi:hypothetical protein
MAATKTRSARSSSAKKSADSNGGSAQPERQSAGTLKQVASKAKTPAIAGGAALAGLAGGMAIARNGTPESGGTAKALTSATKAFGQVAVQVGKAGYRIGELTAEVRRVREQASRRD